MPSPSTRKQGWFTSCARAPPPGPDVPALGYGLSYGVSCRESYPFATPEDLAAAGRKAFPDYPASIQREGVDGWAYFNEKGGGGVRRLLLARSRTAPMAWTSTADGLRADVP